MMPAELPAQVALLALLAVLLLDFVRGETPTMRQRLTALLIVLAVAALGFVLPLAGQPPSPGGGAHVTDGSQARDGTWAQIDFPKAEWIKNKGGSDGLGLCVFASATHAARWHHLDCEDFFEWMRQHPGGGYPEKFAAMLTRYCREKNKPEPRYLQVQTRDMGADAALDLLNLACRNGHLCGVTYSRSPTGRYGGQTIAHMLNLVASRAGASHLWAVMDNNFQGYEWMSEAEFRRTFIGGGNGWGIIFLAGGPPPPPKE